MNREVQVRFCERFGGETPPYLLDQILKIVSVADIHPYKIVTLLCKTMVRHGGRQPHRLCHESRISHSTESLISGYKCLNPLGRFGGMGLIIEFDFSDCFQRVYIQKVTGRQSSVLPFHPPI
jgi:hypothetical protein